MAERLGLTVEEIAQQYDLDPSTVYRWANSWRWISAIVDMRSPIRYDPDQVQGLVSASSQDANTPDLEPERPGLTVREISARYRIGLNTVHRWTQAPEWQAAVVNTRGPAKEYRAEVVDALVRERVWLPPVETGIPAHRLLTLVEISEYTGIPYPDVKYMAADVAGRGSTLGPEDDVDGDRRMWMRSTVDERVWGRQNRKRRR